MHHDLVSAADCGGSNAYTGRAHTPVRLSCASADADAPLRSISSKPQCLLRRSRRRRTATAYLFLGSPRRQLSQIEAYHPQHVDEIGPRASGDWRSPRTLPAKPARLASLGDGVPRHRVAASGAGCDLCSQGLASGLETSSGCAANCWTGPGSWVCEPVIFTQMWENNRLTATQIHYGGCAHSGG